MLSQRAKRSAPMSECFWSAMKFAQEAAKLPSQAKGAVQTRRVFLWTKMSPLWRVQMPFLALDNDWARGTAISQLSKVIAL